MCRQKYRATIILYADRIYRTDNHVDHATILSYEFRVIMSASIVKLVNVQYGNFTGFLKTHIIYAKVQR